MKGMFNKAVKMFFEITSPFQNGLADFWGLCIFYGEFSAYCLQSICSSLGYSINHKRSYIVITPV